jgi:hypothetical protein
VERIGRLESGRGTKLRGVLADPQFHGGGAQFRRIEKKRTLVVREPLVKPIRDKHARLQAAFSSWIVTSTGCPRERTPRFSRRLAPSC